MIEKDVIKEFNATWLNYRPPGDMVKTYNVYAADLTVFDMQDVAWAYKEARMRAITPNVPEYGKTKGWDFFPRIAEIVRLVQNKIMINEAYNKAQYLIKQFGIDCSIGIDDPILSESINSIGGLYRLVSVKLYPMNLTLFAIAYGTGLLNYELSKELPEGKRIKGRHELQGKAWTSITIDKFSITRNKKGVNKVDCTYQFIDVKITHKLEAKTAELLTGKPFDASKIKPFPNGRDM